MNSFRRFVALFLHAFAFGGFLFYAGIVVPAGTMVLGATTQGFVTRQVTNGLNLAVLVAMIVLLWEILAAWKWRTHKANRVLLSCAGVVFVAWLVLFVLHFRLDAALSESEFAVSEPEQFYQWHRVYLWTSTIQWLCSLPILWILTNTGFPSETKVTQSLRSQEQSS